MHNNNNIDVLI